MTNRLAVRAVRRGQLCVEAVDVFAPLVLLNRKRVFELLDVAIEIHEGSGVASGCTEHVQSAANQFAGAVENEEPNEACFQFDVSEPSPHIIEAAVRRNEAGVGSELHEIAASRELLCARHDNLRLDHTDRGRATAYKDVAGPVANPTARLEVGFDAEFLNAERQHSAAKRRDPAKIGALGWRRLLLEIAEKAEGAVKLGASVERDTRKQVLVFGAADRERVDRIRFKIREGGVGGRMWEGAGDVSNRHGDVFVRGRDYPLLYEICHMLPDWQHGNVDKPATHPPIHFVNAFTKVLRRVLKQAPFENNQRALALFAGIDRGLLHRVLDEESEDPRQATPELVGRLCATLPANDAADLLRAYLDDVVGQVASAKEAEPKDDEARLRRGKWRRPLNNVEVEIKCRAA